MIDFTLTENDEKILAAVREEALICRNYARYYDEHEEEFAPAELPEAKDFKNPFAYLATRDDLDSSMGVMSMLISAGQTWGDYTVRMRRGSGGLGNAALRASGSPEQQKRWGGKTLAPCWRQPPRAAAGALPEAQIAVGPCPRAGAAHCPAQPFRHDETARIGKPAVLVFLQRHTLAARHDRQFVDPKHQQLAIFADHRDHVVGGR